MDARSVPSMKQRLSSLLLAAALAAFAGMAQAEKADSTKPMNIEADALRWSPRRRFAGGWSGRLGRSGFAAAH